jgi:molecular chaperone GrpE (heat shock protein)
MIHLRSVLNKNENIQQLKTACEQLERDISDKEKSYNSLMRSKEDMAQGFDNEIKRLQRERDDLMKRYRYNFITHQHGCNLGPLYVYPCDLKIASSMTI